VVEAEGWLYHGNPEQFARDLERYTTMTVTPLTVLRFGHHHVTREPAWVRACVESAWRTGEMRRSCRRCA
jgi:very-short-patch-repair endonuclease